MRERRRVVLSVYLILRQEESVLLYLRQNTGFEDGKYGLVSGHVEANESAKQAMVREASEEAGIHLLESDLKFAHVIHRTSDRDNVDIFFECDQWTGSIENREPDKCAELAFYPLDDCPENLIPYIRNVLKAVKTETAYSESGW